MALSRRRGAMVTRPPGAAWSTRDRQPPRPRGLAGQDLSLTVAVEERVSVRDTVSRTRRRQQQSLKQLFHAVKEK